MLVSIGMQLYRESSSFYLYEDLPLSSYFSTYGFLTRTERSAAEYTHTYSINALSLIVTSSIYSIYNHLIMNPLKSPVSQTAKKFGIKLNEARHTRWGRIIKEKEEKEKQ